MAARAVEAGDIVLDEGNEGAECDGAVGGPGIVEPDDSRQLARKDGEIQRANDGHSACEACFFKQPAGERIRLGVNSDKPPSAEDVERLGPKERHRREREKGDFKQGRGLVDFGFLFAGSVRF